MNNLTTKDFKEKIFDFENLKSWQNKGDKPIVLDFYADWCTNCKPIKTMLSELKKHYQNVDFYQINSEEEYQLIEYFKLRNLPTLILIPAKGEPKQLTGTMPKNKLEDAIKSII